jgi:hypothetical protein
VYNLDKKNVWYSTQPDGDSKGELGVVKSGSYQRKFTRFQKFENNN